MTKFVTTEMNEHNVTVVLQCLASSFEESSLESLRFEFPFSVVNPRIALQIATLLVSDPTIPQAND